MIAVYVILALLAALLAYLLTAPLRLEIDTSKGVLRVRFHALAGARLNATGNSLVLQWNILGIHKDLDLLSILTEQKKDSDRARLEKRRKNSPSIPFRKILAIIRSFKVRKFSLYIDTGDMELNGQLFPLLAGAGWFIHRDMRINFNGKNELVLDIENNALRVMRAYLFTKQKR